MHVKTKHDCIIGAVGGYFGGGLILNISETKN